MSLKGGNRSGGRAVEIADHGCPAFLRFVIERLVGGAGFGVFEFDEIMRELLRFEGGLHNPSNLSTFSGRKEQGQGGWKSY